MSSATATQGPCVVTQLTLCHAGPAPSSRTERIARPACVRHIREERRLRVEIETRTRARTARDRRRRTKRPALVSARRRRRSPPRIDPSGSRGTRPAAAAPTASAEASDRARRRAHRRRGGARRLVACRATRRAHRASRARQPSPRGTSTRARASIPLGASRARGFVSVKARGGVMTVAVEVPAPALVRNSHFPIDISQFLRDLESAFLPFHVTIICDWLLYDHLNFFPRPSRRLEFLGFAFSHDATATTHRRRLGDASPSSQRIPREVPAAHTFACLRFPAGRHVRVRRADARRASRRAARRRAPTAEPDARPSARRRVAPHLLGRADARPRRRRRRARGRAARASCVAAPARARGLRARGVASRARAPRRHRARLRRPRGRRPRRRARSRWTARAWAGTRRSSTR